jgi:phage terminase small subunit
MRTQKNALTDKQIRFLDEYLVDSCGTKAAVRAGYAPGGANPTAARILVRPAAQVYLAERRRELRDRTLVDAASVIQSLLDIRHAAMSRGELHAAIRANELLGKHLGLFSDRVELSGPSGGPIPQAITVHFVRPDED